MMRVLKPHPSGRPLRRREVKDRHSILNLPPNERLTPGLRKDRDTCVIGFHHLRPADDEDE